MNGSETLAPRLSHVFISQACAIQTKVQYFLNSKVAEGNRHWVTRLYQVHKTTYGHAQYRKYRKCIQRLNFRENVLPEVGSSRKSTDGKLIIWKATHKRRFCPPLSPWPTDPPTTTSATGVRPVCHRSKEIVMVT